MKTKIAFTSLLIVAVALALRLGYIAGRADGWQLGETERTAANALRDSLRALKSPTAADLDRAWLLARGAAIERDHAWRALPFWRRMETPAPNWQREAVPYRLPVRPVLATPEATAAKVYQIPLFPFAEPTRTPSR